MHVAIGRQRSNRSCTSIATKVGGIRKGFHRGIEGIIVVTLNRLRKSLWKSPAKGSKRKILRKYLPDRVVQHRD